MSENRTSKIPIYLKSGRWGWDGFRKVFSVKKLNTRQDYFVCKYIYIHKTVLASSEFGCQTSGFGTSAVFVSNGN